MGSVTQQQRKHVHLTQHFIIDFREKHGKFKRVEDLMKVKGIGEKTFMNLKDLITVDSGKK